MSPNSLRDLYMAGVKWELVEKTVPAAQEKAHKVTTHTYISNQDFTTTTHAQSTVIPAIAPVTLSDIQDKADKIPDLQTFLDSLGTFDHPLRPLAKQTSMPCFGQNPNGLVIITDAPGADDEISGQILSGAAGNLMDKMLSAIGLDRGSVSILPLVFWRTPGGRTPTRDEIDLAKPLVTRAIELLQPKAILTLGTLTAAEWIDVKLPKSHGIVFKDATDTSVIPIYHPNYVMLKPEAKRDVWEALQKLQILLKKSEE